MADVEHLPAALALVYLSIASISSDTSSSMAFSI